MNFSELYKKKLINLGSNRRRNTHISHFSFENIPFSEAGKQEIERFLESVQGVKVEGVKIVSIQSNDGELQFLLCLAVSKAVNFLFFINFLMTLNRSFVIVPCHSFSTND